MRAEILSIGTELLVGSTLNTNARFLAKKLAEHAIDVYRQVTVGDNVERIAEAFRTACGRSDLVVSSGGLGPTEDDATARGLSRFLGEPLELHAPTLRAVRERLRKKRYRMTPLIARQCRIVRGAKAVFQNRWGTAPGVLYERLTPFGKKWLLLLPGPPRELEPMFASAFPGILKRMALPRQAFVMKSLRLACVPESQVAQKITDLLRWKPPLTVGIYAKPGEVELKIMAKAKNKKSAAAMAAKAEKILRRRLKDGIYGEDEETLSSAVGALLRRSRRTLGAAESCTGGLLGHLLTETPGASDYFLGGVVAYDDGVKISALGVRRESLRRHGAVSRRVSREMAEGVRRRLGADLGVGITGIAGPSGGTKTKPAGLVYLSIADASGVKCRQRRFFGKRSDVKMQAAKYALEWLRREWLGSPNKARRR